MAKKNTLFKNTIYKSILSIVNIVVPIIIGPFIMRLLDVDLYGMYNRQYPSGRAWNLCCQELYSDIYDASYTL